MSRFSRSDVRQTGVNWRTLQKARYLIAKQPSSHIDRHGRSGDGKRKYMCLNVWMYGLLQVTREVLGMFSMSHSRLRLDGLGFSGPERLHVFSFWILKRFLIFHFYFSFLPSSQESTPALDLNIWVNFLFLIWLVSLLLLLKRLGSPEQPKQLPK